MTSLRSLVRLIAGVPFWRAAAAVATAASLVGCAANYATPDQRSVPPEVVQSSVKFQKEYLLTVGDQLEVVVWRVPEASRVVVVRSDGNISLPLLQDVPAVGLTARELAARITEGLSKRLINPQVSVLPQNVRQPMVFVLGDVNAPAAYPLRGATNAMQALALAGGVRRTGTEADVSIIRMSADGHLLTIPVATDLQQGQPAPYMNLAALPLQADDIVFVPEGGRSQVTRFLDDIILKPLQTILTYRLIANQ
jgi:protein involved in polysaccharide export with SLBB domain